MKDIVSSFTLFIFAFCWVHFMDIQLPSEVVTCVKLVIYMHLLLGIIYVIKFAMARPKVPGIKKIKATVQEDREYHLSPVVD